MAQTARITPQKQVSARMQLELIYRDWESMSQEVGTVSIRQQRGWISNCANTLVHLLKIQYKSSFDSVSHWRTEVLAFRKKMYEAVRDNPAMKGQLDSMVAPAWHRAGASAVHSLMSHSKHQGSSSEKRLRRTWTRVLPSECPYILRELIGYDPFDKSARPNENDWPAQVEDVLTKQTQIYQFALPTRHEPRSQQALHKLSDPGSKENSAMPARNDQDHKVDVDRGTASENERPYWEDPWSWARRQFKALRERNFEDVNWRNIIEEIERIVKDTKQEWIRWIAPTNESESSWMSPRTLVEDCSVLMTSVSLKQIRAKARVVNTLGPYATQGRVTVLQRSRPSTEPEGLN